MIVARKLQTMCSKPKYLKENSQKNKVLKTRIAKKSSNDSN